MFTSTSKPLSPATTVFEVVTYKSRVIAYYFVGFGGTAEA